MRSSVAVSFVVLNLIQNGALCSKRDRARRPQLAKFSQNRFEQSAHPGHLYLNQPPSDLPEVGGKLESRWHKVRLRLRNERYQRAMIKTLDLITEVVSNPKKAFRKVADTPKKAEKHRYERRKVREYLRLGDWTEQAAAS